MTNATTTILVIGSTGKTGRRITDRLEMRGPRLLGFRDAVAEVGAAAGREIQFVLVRIDDYVAALTEYGMPRDFVWLLNHLFTEVPGSKAQLRRYRPDDAYTARKR